MRKGALKHKFGRQFMECKSRFTRRRGAGYRPAPRLIALRPKWNCCGATREEWRIGTDPGLLTEREQRRLINKHFNCRNSRREVRWAEPFVWRR